MPNNCFCILGNCGQVVHSGASRAQNIDAIFYMVRWDLYGFQKRCIGTRYAELVFLHPVGYVGHVFHFGASVV
jgi:hypothetical protein